MLGRYVSCSSKQVGAVVKSIQTFHFSLDWKKVQVNNKLHVYINMDRQSLTKQIMDFILAKNQKFILVHGKFWWGKKIQFFYYYFGGSFKIFLVGDSQAEPTRGLVIRAWGEIFQHHRCRLTCDVALQSSISKGRTHWLFALDLSTAKGNWIPVHSDLSVST